MTRYLLICCLCCLPVLVKAQGAAATAPAHKAPYLQYPIIPAFPLTLPDGNTITKNDLRKNTSTVVFVFSVDCDHCKHFTQELLQHIDQFRKVQILMVTPFKPDQMKEYYNTYKIRDYPNIIMASEPTRQIMYFYDLHYFPGVYVYNRKQQLVKGFEGTVKLEQLLEALKG